MSASPFTSARPEFRSETLAGSSTVWSMVSSQMAKCPATRQSVEEMIPLTPSSAKPERGNMCPVLYLWTSNQRLLVWSLLLSLQITPPTRYKNLALASYNQPRLLARKVAYRWYLAKTVNIRRLVLIINVLIYKQTRSARGLTDSCSTPSS